MDMKRLVLSLLLAVGTWSVLNAQRQDILLNDNWHFRFSHQVEHNLGKRVDLPHTWNTVDALIGKWDYKRGIGNYNRILYIAPEWEGKRLFLRFEGVNSVANVFLNGKHLGEHRGGYGAFIFEITEQVNYGTNNHLLVRVNNAETLNLMPLVGDFNFYGGIYRDVHLLITDNTCISPLDYASPGIYLVQQKVSREEAQVDVKINFSNRGKESSRRLHLQIKDGDKLICEQSRNILLPENTDTQEVLSVLIEKPHLWNGRKDPFMYQVEVMLYADDNLLDKVIQPLGLRYYHTDPEKGFFLNGKHMPLHGVCRHQDRYEVGNALRRQHHEEDVDLMLEMGVNAVRLAHYPQASYMYDLMDKYGFIVWAEIPFVGPGGYEDKGFVDIPDFRANGKEQLKELIRQHYNHPSICFWGLFNELKEEGDNPVEYVEELNELAHVEDATRPTTAASNQEGNLNFITNHIAWNRYDGWYGAKTDELGRFLDKKHKEHPQLRIGISEYGAGASIYHQQDTLIQAIPTSTWHPENWQTYYHMANWKIISDRPYVWGSFIWNMFGFGAAHRTEGDRPGINDKGLVTFDRKVRKDAFYFYKANWNSKEQTLHLAEKRCTVRHSFRPQTFTVFTNCPVVELWVNGKSLGNRKPDAYATVLWDNIYLLPGINKIKVTSVGSCDRQILSDEMIVKVE